MNWKRLLRLLLGLTICSVGVVLAIQANIGYSPWVAFTSGISNLTGLSFGTISIITGFIILAIVLMMGEKAGLGTLLDITVIGLQIDWLQSLDLIPLCQSLITGIMMLLVGLFCTSIGTYFSIGAGFGCGPRDSLMVALDRRLKRLSIGTVRGLIEGTVLIIGWLLGGQIGLGTVISVFGLTFILDLVFRTLHFDAKIIVHENLQTTAKQLLNHH